MIKNISLLCGFLLLFVLGAVAQELVEIDGIYYHNNKAYSGRYESKYENGNPHIQMILVNGLKDGEVQIYFESGQLNEVRSYSMNLMHGTWTTYNESGIKVGEANYQYDKKHGPWYIWNDQGKLIYELEYTEGEKTGVWKIYDENGKVVNERNYSSR